MTYSMKPLACDPQRIKGMSEKLIVSHYENNYGGAVKRLNAISDQLAALDFASAPVLTVIWKKFNAGPIRKRPSLNLR